MSARCLTPVTYCTTRPQYFERIGRGRTHLSPFIGPTWGACNVSTPYPRWQRGR